MLLPQCLTEARVHSTYCMMLLLFQNVPMDTVGNMIPLVRLVFFQVQDTSRKFREHGQIDKTIYELQDYERRIQQRRVRSIAGDISKQRCR